mmetsp:Transcript_9261/g.15574  ORF Transcript_9261/g.15574 Transcript_9261/m.15574 type:complete len:271 (+) Transcript_9261:140-952(+)
MNSVSSLSIFQRIKDYVYPSSMNGQSAHMNKNFSREDWMEQMEKFKNEVPKDKCRSLSLRGGGTKGAYEVGVIQSLFDHLPLEEFQYDVITGVSIGAVNAATLAMFDKGEEQEAIDTLKEYWFDFETDEIFVEWSTWGPIAGFWKPSFFDDTPTHNRINSRLKNPFRKRVAYQSVNINDGKVYSFDETLDPKLQGESVAASASIPVAFYPTATIGDLQLVDGGTFTDLNLQDAIDKCREVVKEDKDIIVDVVMCQSDPVKIDEMKNSWLF